MSAPPPAGPMRIVVLDRRFAHHSAYSGYRQAIRRQPEVEYVASRIPRRVPERAALALVRRVGRAAYTETSLGFEVAAARLMLTRPRAIYHVPYGEDDYHLLAMAAPILRRLGGRLVATFHQPPAIFDEAIPAGIAARILPRLDAALVSTAEQAEHLARVLVRSRIHRVPHGVDTAFLAPDARGRPPGRPFTVITVGTWQRDFVLWEQTVTALHERGAGVRFILVSRPEVTERLGRLPGVEAHTAILDSQLRALYQEADALFLPLVAAAANNALLEGMASGLPVIATDLPGVREYADGAAAHLVPRFDPAAAVEVIADLAAAMPARRAELGVVPRSLRQ